MAFLVEPQMPFETDSCLRVRSFRSMLWQSLRKELHNGSDIYRRIHILKLIATFYLFSGTSCAITCHCSNDERCNQVDGSCPNGCAPGWQGPGCQLGNLALKKPANQSSTYAIYSADNAVNGVKPPQGDESESNCSHTSESNDYPHWWFVSLSETEDYVLKNITIVNRQKPYDSELRSFYILYTNESTGQPNLTSWKQCTYYSDYQSVTEATYTCSSGTAIGRRVAVYLDVLPLYRNNRKLVLCEVIVNGYSYQETVMFRNTSITVTSNCDNITVTLGALPVVPPTFLVVYMNTSKGIYSSRVERVRNDGTRSVTLQAVANVTYSISVAPETCCIGSMCLDDQAISIERSKCVVGASTMPASIEMPQYKKYDLNTVGNILNVLASGSSECSSTNISIQCKKAETKDNLTLCFNKGTCTLDPRYNHACILNVTYSDGFLDSSTSNITIGTADFSQINLTVKTSCNTAALSVEDPSTKWDLAPTSVFFTMNGSQWNETKVKQIRVPENQGDYKATFDVVPNTTYSVWAFPETCWPAEDCSSQIPGVCNLIYECFNGTSSIMTIINIMPGEFDLSECMDLVKSSTTSSGASVGGAVTDGIAQHILISVSVVLCQTKAF